MSLLRCRNLNCATCGAAEAVRPVHVLYIGLRMDIAAGRDGPHDIGDWEPRGITALAVERRAEAVISELGVRWLQRILDPAQRPGIARRHKPRIVDLEAGGEIVSDHHACELWPRLGEREDQWV